MSEERNLQLDPMTIENSPKKQPSSNNVKSNDQRKVPKEQERKISSNAVNTDINKERNKNNNEKEKSLNYNSIVDKSKSNTPEKIVNKTSNSNNNFRFQGTFNEKLNQEENEISIKNDNNTSKNEVSPVKSDSRRELNENKLNLNKNQLENIKEENLEHNQLNRTTKLTEFKDVLNKNKRNLNTNKLFDREREAVSEGKESNSFLMKDRFLQDRLDERVKSSKKIASLSQKVSPELRNNPKFLNIVNDLAAVENEVTLSNLNINNLNEYLSKQKQNNSNFNIKNDDNNNSLKSISMLLSKRSICKSYSQKKSFMPENLDYNILDKFNNRLVENNILENYNNSTQRNFNSKSKSKFQLGGIFNTSINSIKPVNKGAYKGNNIKLIKTYNNNFNNLSNTLTIDNNDYQPTNKFNSNYLTVFKQKSKLETKIKSVKSISPSRKVNLLEMEVMLRNIETGRTKENSLADCSPQIELGYISSLFKPSSHKERLKDLKETKKIDLTKKNDFKEIKITDKFVFDPISNELINTKEQPAETGYARKTNAPPSDEKINVTYDKEYIFTETIKSINEKTYDNKHLIYYQKEKDIINNLNNNSKGLSTNCFYNPYNKYGNMRNNLNYKFNYGNSSNTDRNKLEKDSSNNTLKSNILDRNTNVEKCKASDKSFTNIREKLMKSKKEVSKSSCFLEESKQKAKIEPHPYQFEIRKKLFGKQSNLLWWHNRELNLFQDCTKQSKKLDGKLQEDSFYNPSNEFIGRMVFLNDPSLSNITPKSKNIKESPFLQQIAFG